MMTTRTTTDRQATRATPPCRLFVDGCPGSRMARYEYRGNFLESPRFEKFF